jgi:hypothetical protein
VLFNHVGIVELISQYFKVFLGQQRATYHQVTPFLCMGLPKKLT